MARGLTLTVHHEENIYECMLSRCYGDLGFTAVSPHVHVGNAAIMANVAIELGNFGRAQTHACKRHQDLQILHRPKAPATRR
jgi:hypothetical protein